MNYPVLNGDKLFRNNEPIHVNRSDELPEYCGIIHRHDFVEIACVISGSGIHIVSDRRFDTSAGDLFIIDSDTGHGFLEKEDGSRPLVYNCVFMPHFVDVSLLGASHFEDIASSYLFKSLFPGDFTPNPDLRLYGADFIAVRSIFEKMYDEYKLMKKGFAEILRAYLIELIVKLFRCMGEADRKLPQHKNHEYVLKTVEYMKKNYNSDLSLSSLAMQAFLSRNYFSRLFRETTGTSVGEYIQYLRTEQACTLLGTTGMKISEIALQVGFNDIKFFYGVFKKITGKTPGDYRNQLKRNQPKIERETK